MKLSLSPPHYVIAALVLFLYAEPKAAALFPVAAGVLGVLYKVGILAVGLVGGTSSSALPGVNAKAVALRAAKVLTPPMALVMLLGALLSCTPQQVSAIPSDVSLAICIITTTATDVALGETPPQVVADDLAKCGTDVATIASVLDAETKAQIVVAGVDAGTPPAYALKLAAISAWAKAPPDGGK